MLIKKIKHEANMLVGKTPTTTKNQASRERVNDWSQSPPSSLWYLYMACISISMQVLRGLFTILSPA